MFSRGRGEQAEGPVSVEITLEDGQELRGKLMLPPGRALTEVLNSAAAFVEFEPTRGQRMYIAKSALQCVKPMNGPPAPKLAVASTEAGAFDPAAILGVKADASRQEVRDAYLALAKVYHPDRYAAADLPSEVSEYLSAMARRINAAYDALEATQKRQAAKQEPVFTKAGLD